MIWVGLLLVGFGLADLAHAVWRVRLLPETLAAVVTVGVGLLAGFTSGAEIGLEIAVAVAVVAWGSAVRYGFGRGWPWLPLTFLTMTVAATIALSAWGSASQAHGGPLSSWLGHTQFPVLHDLDPSRAVLLLGAFLIQGSTANVIVRLVLLATHTINPETAQSRDIGPRVQGGTPRLKGGRLLGPMERILILGFGVHGDLTAAGIVVAAKGLVRFPELQAARNAVDQPPIEVVTEYFLVGSFLSWMVALATLVLVTT